MAKMRKMNTRSRRPVRLKIKAQHETPKTRLKGGFLVFGAGRENRTPVLSMARIRSTTKLYPREGSSYLPYLPLRLQA